MTRWVYGMRQVGERPMDEMTSGRIHLLGSRNFLRLMWCRIVGLVASAAIVIVFMIADKAPDGNEPEWLIPLAVVAAITLGLAVKFGSRYKLYYRNARRLANTDVIEIYEDEQGNQAEVLQKSHIVLSFNGKTTKRDLATRIRQTADAPTVAPTPEFPMRLRGATSDGPLRERALSEEEKRHIWWHCVRSKDPGLVSATSFLTFLGCAPILVGFLIGEPIPIIVGIGFLVLSAFGWRKLWTQVRHEREVRQDLRAGTVLIVEAAQWEPLRFPNNKYLEVLPKSGLIWRVDDEPAAYRLSA